MTTDSATKPSYLGLLNAISLGESAAGVYLGAWAAVAQDPDLKSCLSLVAQRETTHGEVFRQRIERMGYQLRTKDDPSMEKRAAFFGDPVISDAEKVRRTRGGEEPNEGRDVLADLEARITDEMDPLTQATMRWYIAEERDTGALIREVYDRVLARE